MLLLASTTDALQVVTSSAAAVRVHATWVDINTSTGAITPGRTNTAISSAATTSVAGSPASGVQRNVKTVHIRNTDATLSVNVTVQHTDGTNVAQLHKRTLVPSDSFEYTDQGGFSSAVSSAQVPGIAHGRLVVSDSTHLNFAPFTGQQIKVNGALYSIGNGLLIPSTGISIDGTVGNVVPNAAYLVAVGAPGGVLTPYLFSALTHTTSLTAGNVGTEIVASNDAYSVVGMCATNASAQFQDDNSFRGVISWFNRRNKWGYAVTAQTGLAVPTSGYGAIGSGSFMMLSWGDEAVDSGFNGQAQLFGSNAYSANCQLNVMRRPANYPTAPDAVHSGTICQMYLNTAAAPPAYLGNPILMSFASHGWDQPTEGRSIYFAAYGPGSSGLTMDVFNCYLVGSTRG